MTAWTDAEGFAPDAIDLLSRTQIIKSLKGAGYGMRMAHIRPTEAMRQQLRESSDKSTK